MPSWVYSPTARRQPRIHQVTTEEREWAGKLERRLRQKSAGEKPPSWRLCSTEPGISKRSRVTTKQRLWSGLFRSSSEVAVCQKPTAPDYRKLRR